MKIRHYALLLMIAVTPLLGGCFAAVATGVATTAFVAADRRTTGAIADDTAIELKANNQIGNLLQGKGHVDVTSYNRIVLLTGEIPDASFKSRIENAVRGIANVRGVNDELTVMAPSSLSSRANDTYITSKVKAKFVDANKFPANYVKVVTERGIVYLLGLVTHQQAEDAVQIARNTGGVQKVVTAFEYID